ncbi:MAG: phosphate signaling complex protein PhoU [Cellulosilyticaceae bacterium]
MPRKAFEQELEQLRQDVIDMGGEVEGLLKEAIQAIVSRDVELSKAVIKKDDMIDEKELTIQKKCIKLLTHQQPLAKDLRFITAVLKLITDFERIADHCEDICQYSLKLDEVKWTHEEAYKRHIERMANDVLGMLSMVVDSFVKQDITMLHQVRAQDDVIDQEFYRIWKEIIAKMEEDKAFISKGAHYIMMIKYLERMADHVTNVAEWLIYNITGHYTNEE